MSNALYYARNKTTEKALEQLICDYDLEKGFESGKEQIYRGDQLVLSYTPKYIFLYIYDKHDKKLKSNIQRIMFRRG